MPRLIVHAVLVQSEAAARLTVIVLCYAPLPLITAILAEFAHLREVAAVVTLALRHQRVYFCCSIKTH